MKREYTNVITRRDLPNEVIANNGEFLADIRSHLGDVCEELEGEDHADDAEGAGCDSTV